MTAPDIQPDSWPSAANDDQLFRLADSTCPVCGVRTASPATIVKRLGRLHAFCLPACAAAAGIWPWAGATLSL